MRNITRDKILLIIAVVITAGALVSRSYAMAGFYISFAGLVALFLSGIAKTFKGIKGYRKLPSLSRAWVALQGVELILIVNSILSHHILYFFVLIVLAAEYFIYDTGRRR